MSHQVNLHSHSEGSFLDGLATVGEIVSRAVELKQSFVAVTDHGECNQHPALAREAARAGLGYILGMEGYWLPADELARCRQEKRYPYPSHICLLARNDVGLRNLWALSSVAYTDPHFYYKPIASLELLKEYSEGLAGSDGCMMTHFADAVEGGDESLARQIIGSLLEVFGDHFYMELHTWRYYTPPDEGCAALNERMTRLNQAKVRIAGELSVPLVVVNDSHHARPEQWQNRELVWGFSTAKDGDKLASSISEGGQKADHVMGDEELYLAMQAHGVGLDVVREAIENSYRIAQGCTAHITPTLRVPRMCASEREDLSQLIGACERGFNEVISGRGMDEDRYLKRLEEELTLICDNDFAGYFNVVAAVSQSLRSGGWSQFVRKNSEKDPLLLGPSRGSVGGSLVAYLLGIDNLDPIKYGTMFSRFLSPGRKSLPDIDIDLPQSQRPEALEYLRARFGAENVCAVGTLNRNGMRAALRDVGRAMGIPIPDVNQICEAVAGADLTDSDGQSMTWDEVVDKRGGELSRFRKSYPDLFRRAQELTGLIRHPGVHASGVLISSDPVLGRIPLRRTKNGVMTTQFEMGDVEELGGVKFDWLGIRHLDTLSVARQLILDRHGVWIDYEGRGATPPPGASVVSFADEHFADPTIWEQIDEGHTVGVFQVETPGCTAAAVKFRPRSERDLADLCSIIRPGVVDAGLKDVYLDRRSGKEPVVYDHPLMERFVGPGWSTDTLGVMVYQEQLIACVQELAGFTPDEADDLRKAVGKKLMDKLVPMKAKFIDGCLANPEFVHHHGVSVETRVSRELAQKIWTSIEASGRYAFNYSHAVGYAIISGWEVWTKHHYPREFLTALLATDLDSVNRYVREARRLGVAVLPPDVNESQRRFSLTDEGIRYGVESVRGVGRAAARDILAGQPYRDLADFLARSGAGANKTCVYNLCLVGGFDSLCERTEVLGQLERLRAMEGLADSTLANPERLRTVVDRRMEADPTKYAIAVPDFADPLVVYRIERELVGSCITVDPMERYASLLDGVALSDPSLMYGIEEGEVFVVGGQVGAVRTLVTKKGKFPGREMAQVVLTWNDADFKLTCFPEAWKRFKTLLSEDAPVACSVKKLQSGASIEEVERLDLLLGREFR